MRTEFAAHQALQQSVTCPIARAFASKQAKKQQTAVKALTFTQRLALAIAA